MDWVRGQTIGRGSTATVSIATANHSGEVFAVKTADLSNSEFLKWEQRILSTLLCPQIVAYKGCDISSENGKLLYNLFLEYASGGTLMDAISQHGGRLDEARIRSYTRAILQGLEYLHGNGTVHCDIKCQNVLVTSDGAKIADLGCARRVDEVLSADRGSRIRIGGTPIYMAPEVARGEEQGFPADVWALGCTVIEMATGQPPWGDVSDPVSALYRIGFSTDVPEIPRFMSKQAVDFLSKCLKREPGERWSASELLEHDFVNQPDSFLNSCYYKLETPTSVLVPDLWESVEGFEIPSWKWNSTHERCSGSPMERIRQLSEQNSSCSSKKLNWEWDETWATVRGNGRREPEAEVVTSSQGGSLLCGNEVIPEASGEITTWVGQEYTSDIPNESISEINTCITSCKSNNSRHEKSSLMTCKCLNHILWRILTFLNKNVRFLIILAILFCWL